MTDNIAFTNKNACRGCPLDNYSYKKKLFTTIMIPMFNHR